MRTGLSAGHGGINRGSASPDGDLLEPDLTLEVAIEACAVLSRGDLVEPLLVRVGDDNLTHEERAGICRRGGCGAAIEIHFNWSQHPDRHGAELYYWRSDAVGKELGLQILRALPPRTDWRAWPSDERREGALCSIGAHSVTRAYHEAGVPCALIELAFLSCAADCAMLRDKHNRGVLAHAVAAGAEAWARLQGVRDGD